MVKKGKAADHWGRRGAAGSRLGSRRPVGGDTVSWTAIPQSSGVEFGGNVGSGWQQNVRHEGLLWLFHLYFRCEENKWNWVYENILSCIISSNNPDVEQQYDSIQYSHRQPIWALIISRGWRKVQIKMDVWAAISIQTKRGQSLVGFGFLGVLCFLT